MMRKNSKLRKFKICNRSTESLRRSLKSAICNSESGLTLIEVMVAMIVLTIGLLGVAMMQYMAVGGNAFGREMQIATEVAQERLEIIKPMNYANAVTGMNNAGTYWWISESLLDPDPSRFGGLTFTRVTWVTDNCRNTQVEDPDPNNPLCNPIAEAICENAMTNMRTITVRVCWVDKNGGNHSVTLSGMKWNESAIP